MKPMFNIIPKPIIKMPSQQRQEGTLSFTLFAVSVVTDPSELVF
jgi:hypothetical protein